MIYGTLAVGDIVRVTEVYRPGARRVTKRAAAALARRRLKRNMGKLAGMPTEVGQYIGVVTRVGVETAAVRRMLLGETPEEWRNQNDEYWNHEVVHFGMMERVHPEDVLPYMRVTVTGVRKGDLVEVQDDDVWKTGIITKSFNTNQCQVIIDGVPQRCLKSSLLLISRAKRKKTKKTSPGGEG